MSDEPSTADLRAEADEWATEGTNGGYLVLLLLWAADRIDVLEARTTMTDPSTDDLRNPSCFLAMDEEGCVCCDDNVPVMRRAADRIALLEAEIERLRTPEAIGMRRAWASKSTSSRIAVPQRAELWWRFPDE